MSDIRRAPFSRLLLVALLVALTAIGRAQRSEADKALPNPYSTIENYLKLPAGRTLGGSSSIDIDPDGRSIWLADRCAANSCLGSNLAMIFKFDAAGNMVKNFGAGLIVYPHGISVDR